MPGDMTQGNPQKLMLRFAIPIFLGNLFQQFYNIVDTAIVGKFVGTEALAAVGSVAPLNFLVIGFAIGMCGGFCIPVAQNFGAKDMKMVRQCLVNILYLVVVLSVLIGIVSVLLTRPILAMMNTPVDVMEHAYNYIVIIFAGIGVTMFYNIFAGMSRAVGDSRTPLYFLVAASFFHVGLDILFIVVFGMGTSGAAYATILSQGVAGIGGLAYMWRKFPELRIPLSEMRPNPVVIMNLLHMGVPMALQSSITAIGSIVLQSTVNLHGAVIMATATAAQKVQLIVIQPIEAIGTTMVTYSSQNLGAGRLDRVKSGVKVALVITTVLSIISGLFSIILGPKIGVLLFVNDDVTGIAEGIRYYLFIVSLFLWALGILLVLRNTVQALGYALPAMLAGIFELIGRSVVGIMFVQPFGFNAICFASPVAWILASLLLGPVYLHIMRLLKASIGDGTHNIEQP